MSGPERRSISRTLKIADDLTAEETRSGSMSILTIMPSGKTDRGRRGNDPAGRNSWRGRGAHPQMRGQANCGTCHIFVQEGRKGLSKIAREENEKLDTIVGVGSKSRLACQAKVLGTEEHQDRIAWVSPRVFSCGGNNGIAKGPDSRAFRAERAPWSRSASGRRP